MPRSLRIAFWGNQIVDSSHALKAEPRGSVNRLFGSFLTRHTGLNGPHAKEKETLATFAKATLIRVPCKQTWSVDLYSLTA